MFELYSQLSKAVDVYNENVIEEIEYYEVLEMIEDRYNEKEVMELIIKLYSAVHQKTPDTLIYQGFFCICISLQPLGHDYLEKRIIKNPPLS